MDGRQERTGGVLMEPRDYDRIADLLMQIRKKYANLKLPDHMDAYNREIMLNTIDNLLKLNDKFGEWDAKGWL